MDHAGHLLIEFAMARSVLVGDRPEPVALRVSGRSSWIPGRSARWWPGSGSWPGRGGVGREA
jgi:hypothetical protein